MGGNGPHSGARNSSFALATLRPDGFAGLGGHGTIQTRPVTVASARLVVTTDIVGDGGSVVVGVDGSTPPLLSSPVTINGDLIAPVPLISIHLLTK
jgi:hypothetical protein